MGHFLLLPQSQSSELSSPGSNTVTYTVSSLPQALQNLFLSIHVYTPAPTLIFATTTLFLFHDSSPLHCCGSCCLLRFILAILKGLEKKKRRKKHQDSEKSSTFQEEETALQFVLLGRQRSELVIVVTSLVPVSFQSDQPPAEGMLCVLHLIFRLCAFVVGKLPHLQSQRQSFSPL